ncbi:MAG TPA: hypothetical protein VER98_07555 [Terriglobia bacterium]|nr:hypothetical protein [Terriglobia bacterium]
MKNIDATRTTTIQRASIEDLSPVGTEIAEEQLQLASGGLWICACYEAASSTFNNDTDYHRVD